MQRHVLVILTALSLAACADGPEGLGGGGASLDLVTAPGPSTFDAREFAWSTATGTGAITGSLTFRRGDARYSCQGSDVLLTPETAWSRRRMLILYGSANAAAAPAWVVRARTASAGVGDYARFVRRTTCDGANHFTFQGLPDGAWFVITVGKPEGSQGEAVAVTRRVETHGGVTAANLS